MTSRKRDPFGPTPEETARLLGVTPVPGEEKPKPVAQPKEPKILVTPNLTPGPKPRTTIILVPVNEDGYTPEDLRNAVHYEIRVFEGNYPPEMYDELRFRSVRQCKHVGYIDPDVGQALVSAKVRLRYDASVGLLYFNNIFPYRRHHPFLEKEIPEGRLYLPRFVGLVSVNYNPDYRNKTLVSARRGADSWDYRRSCLRLHFEENHDTREAQLEALEAKLRAVIADPLFYSHKPFHRMYVPNEEGGEVITVRSLIEQQANLCKAERLMIQSVLYATAQLDP